MMKTPVIAAVAVAALFLFVPGLSRADSVLSVSGPATVTPGQTFVVDVDVTGTTDLYDFGLDLAFDPTVLEATGVSEGALLPTGGSTFFIPGTIDNVGGTVTFNADTLFGAPAGVSGDGTLLVFDFTALAAGTSALTIENEILQDSQGNILVDTTQAGSVTVASQSGSGGGTGVPEPSSLLLLLAGLVGLGMRSAWRKRVSAGTLPI